MSENTIKLAQAEIDRLLGKNTDALKKELKVDDIKVERSVVKNILTEKGMDGFDSLMKSVIGEFSLDIKNRYASVRDRKIIVAKTELINAADFEAELTYPAFIYKVDICGAIAFIKLDSFLFCALSGIPFDGRIKINEFQQIVLKNEIIPLLMHAVLNCFGSTVSRDVMKISIIDEKSFKSDEKIKKNETGVLAIINWNENFKSFGVEKIWLSQEFLGLIKKTKLLNEK
ncbi:MAG: hypothetical protein J6Y93_05710 [Treponema sp.]|nr:hypothetical protein [Treponema sp.]